MTGHRIPVRTLIWGNALVFLVVFGLITAFPRALEFFELKTVDSRFQIRDALGMNPEYSNALVHINLDNYSKQASGVSFWPKTHYADLIQRIAEGNAEAIACDVMFVEWADRAGNEELTESVVNAGSVISPFLLDFSHAASPAAPPESLALDLNPSVEPGTVPQAAGVLVSPLADIAEQSAGVGFVNIIPDADGVVRRVRLVADLDGVLIPSFFLQALSAYLDYDIENIVPVDGSKLILKDFPVGAKGSSRDINVPLDGQGNLVVNLAGPLNPENYPQSYSAWDLLQADGQPDFSGKLVFLSDTSAQHGESGDFSPVPLERLFPRSYVFSNAASSLLHSEFIRPTSNLFAAVAAVLLSVLLVLVCWKASTLIFSLTALGVIVFYAAGVLGLFLFGGWMLPVLPVFITLIAVYLFSSVYRVTVMERYEGVLAGSLESYLSPVLMDRIRDDPDLLRLGGSRKRISVFFSDIVNFTAFTDQADPQEVQDVLERYFEETTAIIFEADGIVDKYMGDGILAFFENSTDKVTSASNAVRCAIAMQHKAAELDQLYREQNRFPFAVRVGIATGYAKVGNIGPRDKIDYTVIGSVVNLSSRLQSFGEPGDVVIDEETLFFVKDDYQISDLGGQELKGFSEPVKVFTASEKTGT